MKIGVAIAINAIHVLTSVNLIAIRVFQRRGQICCFSKIVFHWERTIPTTSVVQVRRCRETTSFSHKFRIATKVAKWSEWNFSFRPRVFQSNDLTDLSEWTWKRTLKFTRKRTRKLGKMFSFLFITFSSVENSSNEYNSCWLFSTFPAFSRWLIFVNWSFDQTTNTRWKLSLLLPHTSTHVKWLMQKSKHAEAVFTWPRDVKQNFVLTKASFHWKWTNGEQAEIWS